MELARRLDSDGLLECEEACFYDGCGNTIAARRHINPDGSIGGLVPNDMVVHASTHIEFSVTVLPGVRIPDGAVIGGPDTIGPGDISSA